MRKKIHYISKADVNLPLKYEKKKKIVSHVMTHVIRPCDSSAGKIMWYSLHLSRDFFQAGKP